MRAPDFGHATGTGNPTPADNFELALVNVGRVGNGVEIAIIAIDSELSVVVSPEAARAIAAALIAAAGGRP